MVLDLFILKLFSRAIILPTNKQLIFAILDAASVGKKRSAIANVLIRRFKNKFRLSPTNTLDEIEKIINQWSNVYII